MMSDSGRLREAIQRLTEAIWNLDQIETMSPEMKEEYASIQRAREKLVSLVKRLSAKPE
jgi:hypothetical protein